MGYQAFGIDVDDEGYPEWHQNRKMPDMDNLTPLHGIGEYAAAYKSFQIMWTAASAGMLSKSDGREFRILGLRLSRYRREHKIPIVQYQRLK